MIEKQGKLIVISAPSGCGKTTIVEHLLKRNKNLARSISYTTREPRLGEANGRDYFFVPPEDFKVKKQSGFFLESAQVFNHFYGTSKEFVKDTISSGIDIVLAIDVQGMKQLKENKTSGIPIVSVFLMPPSHEDLKARLEKRKTETKAQVDERLRIAELEMKEKDLYDFVVVNHTVNQAVSEIEEMIKNDRSNRGAFEKRK